MALIGRTKKAMVRAMCGIKLINRKTTNELKQIFGGTVLNERKVKVAAVRWYRIVLQRNEGDTF